ncbi:MAG: diguanylate cyclase [Xanthomonadales bacterium]|nr:diguanylate cyclase [Xanthomonadales bacterium]
MRRRSRPERGASAALVVVLLALLPWLATAAEGGVALARLDPEIEAVEERRLLAGEHGADFEELAEAELRLPGSARERWLRLTLVPAAGPDREWFLVLRRVPAEAIELLIPEPGGSVRRLRHGFYGQGRFAPLFGAVLMFPLGSLEEGPRTVYLKVASSLPVRIAPRLLPADVAIRLDRAGAMAYTVAYTALVVLVLINLMLFVALRERSYRDLGLWALAVLVWLLARSGHLFELPGLGLLGWWGASALAVAALLLAAAALFFVRGYTDPRRLGSEVDRALLAGIVALLALSAVGLVVPGLLGAILPVLGDFALIGSHLALVAVTAQMWRRGYRRGRIALAILLMLTPFAAVSAVSVSSRLSAVLTLDLAAPLVFALGVLLFSVALVERVIEFRIETARAREESARLGASLRREVALRRYRESTRAQLLQAAAGDAEWLAYHRLLAELRGLLTQRALVVYVVGGDGAELLVCDPQQEQASFRELVRARGEKLRAIGRARAPVEARLERRVAGEEAETPFQYAAVPLPLRRPAWGVVLVEREVGESFTREELASIQEFASLAVELLGEIRSQVALKREADTDPLTGVLNRRAGDAALAETFRRTASGRLPLTVALVDLDHLRAINELHGHAAGDRCLAAVAELIAAHLSRDDAVARYGGEEFLVLMPGRNLVQARELLENLRAAIEGAPVEGEGRRIQVTVSIGVAQRQAEDSEGSLLQRAESALLRAKELGRNRIVTAAQGPAPLRPVPGLY